MCSICGKRYSEKRGLKEHIEIIHQGKNSWPCRTCDQTFPTRNSLKKHRISVHFKGKILDELVKQEPQEMIKSEDLVHKEKKQYKCHVCEACFSERKQIKNHFTGNFFS